MQSSVWKDLLRLIPQRQHDNLIAMTGTGSEIAIQEIVHAEPDYLVLRGRISGTSDAGRVFFLPYEEITFLRFQKLVPEDFVHKLYGLTPPPPSPPEQKSATPAAPVKSSPPAEEATQKHEAKEVPVEAVPPPAPLSSTTLTPARGIERTKLLEKLRQRVQK